MTIIIMNQTLPIMCESQYDVNKLISTGFEVVQTNKLIYLKKIEG